MSADWWYKFFPNRYRRDTRHLSMEQHGIYRALIDEYMVSQQGFKDDPVALAGAAGCPREVMERNWPVLRAFFNLDPKTGRLRLKVCELLIRAGEEKSRKYSLNGTKGGTARKSKKSSSSQPPEDKGNSSNCHVDAQADREEKRDKTSKEQTPPKGGDISRTEAELFFSRLWEAYPGRGGRESGYSHGAAYKGSRKKAFEKFIILLKKETDHEQFTIYLLDACARYTEFLDSKTWQASCHLVTWLNQERWNDDYATTGGGGGSMAQAVAEGMAGTLRQHRTEE